MTIYAFKDWKLRCDLFLNSVNQLGYSQHHSIKNWNLIVDSNHSLSQLTILILVNLTPLQIVIWLYFERSQTFGTPSTILYGKLRFDYRFTISFSLINHFDSNQSYLIENRNMFIFWDQSTNLSSVENWELTIDSNLFLTWSTILILVNH